jgi:hypothetical protein
MFAAEEQAPAERMEGYVMVTGLPDSLGKSEAISDKARVQFGGGFLGGERKAAGEVCPTRERVHRG